jgi:hypothetical protein
MYLPICACCEHGKNTVGLTCKAFPNKIPKSIIEGNPHTEPIEGQENDIVFTPLPGLTEQQMRIVKEDYGVDIERKSTEKSIDITKSTKITRKIILKKKKKDETFLL